MMETMDADIYNLGAPAPDAVRLMVFSHAGIPLAAGLYSSTQWFNSANALFEDASERSRLGVGKIVAERYDSKGLALARWTMYYSADGELIEAYERRCGRAVSLGAISESLARRFNTAAFA